MQTFWDDSKTNINENNNTNKIGIITVIRTTTITLITTVIRTTINTKKIVRITTTKQFEMESTNNSCFETGLGIGNSCRKHNRNLNGLGMDLFEAILSTRMNGVKCKLAIVENVML